ncbi:hypothetical protein CI109_104230 [Kwoniella shandongensis]|uniref:Uncharacterized protein n=1 Tax=Kwoniella shandongensis TaxID=1734106 RepID=A0AAJ8MYH6_9TREE
MSHEVDRPVRFLAFGNNVCRNIDPLGAPVIQTPIDITGNIDCGEIIWHGWTCTIAKDYYHAWGTDPLVSETTSVLPVDAIRRVIGFDRPVGFLHLDGRVSTTHGIKGSGTWDDVAVTGLGAVYASRSLDDLIEGRSPQGPLRHPLLTSSVKLYTTESRVLALTLGPTPHLFELVDVRSLPPRQRKTDEPIKVQLLEEFEGLGVQTVVSGSANRFGIITEAGEAYLLGKGDPELLDFGDEEVRLIGIGSDFEVVVTVQDVFVRGASES